MKKAIQERVWKEFADWCKSRGLRSLPAHPWTVAYYARWCEQRHRHRTILKRMTAISRVHLLHCHKPPDRHPVVVRTLRLLEQRPSAKRRGRPLFRAEDFLETAHKDDVLKSTSKKQKDTLKKRQDKAQPEASLLKRAMRSTPKLVSRRPDAET